MRDSQFKSFFAGSNTQKVFCIQHEDFEKTYKLLCNVLRTILRELNTPWPLHNKHTAKLYLDKICNYKRQTVVQTVLSLMIHT